ncbi:MAG TPA: hypothetical protein DGT23_32415 [Micromonosporaceae bacterium]|nr:hypothetical protein [Micromonosporaceae bacterium]
MSTATLCSRPDCALPRKHRDGCDNNDNHHDGTDACRGCLPAQAAHGIRLCTLHSDQLREDALTAGQLHTELEQQLRRQGGREHTSGSRERSTMPDPAVMEARYHIADVLTGMVDLMVYVRGFSPPTLRGHWRHTHEPASEHVRARLAAEGVGGRAEVGTTKRTATHVEVMAAYVAKHADWFAAHTDAGKHSKALHDATRGKVWALAYPSRSRDYQEIGTCPLVVTVYAEDGSLSEETCGGRVFWYVEQSSLAYCNACDQAETIEWWRLQIMGVPDAVIDTVAAAAWLSDRFRRPVLPSQIANWASRGKLPRLSDQDGKPQRDPRGRQLYRLDELEACAVKMFGNPPLLHNQHRKPVAA